MAERPSEGTKAVLRMVEQIKASRPKKDRRETQAAPFMRGKPGHGQKSLIRDMNRRMGLNFSNLEELE